MTDQPHPITEQELDAYLDGLMEPAERAALEARLQLEPELAQDLERFQQLDTAAKRLFPPASISVAQVDELLKSSDTTQPTPTEQTTGRATSGKMRAAILALAAAIAWIVVGWQMSAPIEDEPFFEPRPVVMVYQEVLENGFEPYYECREEDRFADTFLRRQGQALQLADMPSGSEMLGLSYAGGLTRDTTAMLCRVDGQPVMVFVDRAANDLPLARENSAGSLKIHRVERDGLVFYEVTPFEQSRVIEFLVPVQG